MGIRQLIEKHKKLSMCLGTMLLIAATWFCVWNLRGDSITPTTRWYFTVDYGKTWFADDMTKVPPFDHNGQQAYRARLFTCDGGRTKWCGYIERCNPQVKANIDDGVAHGAAMSSFLTLAGDNMEVQRPGQPNSEWVPKNKTKEYNDVATVACPDDPTKYPEAVVP